MHVKRTRTKPGLKHHHNVIEDVSLIAKCRPQVEHVDCGMALSLVIVSQRLVQSRSETKIWTFSVRPFVRSSVCPCLVWQLLLTGLSAVSCSWLPVLSTTHINRSVYCPKWKRYSLAFPLRNKLSAEDRSLSYKQMMWWPNSFLKKMCLPRHSVIGRRRWMIRSWSPPPLACEKPWLKHAKFLHKYPGHLRLLFSILDPTSLRCTYRNVLWCIMIDHNKSNHFYICFTW